ncbi:MAG: helix-turn-helix transcriptional regulator [Clostridia bacterium]|nr:helix-turn-helix transcriptional regulator [Clostridia bacterium]
MTFAEKVFKLRRKAGLSQEELAEKLDVSRQAISRWEMGIAIPDAANLLQLSRLFDVTVDYLIKDELSSDEDIPLVKSKQADICKETKKLPVMLNAVWMGTAIAVTLSVLLFWLTVDLPVTVIPMLTLPFPVFYYFALHRDLASVRSVLFSGAILLLAVNLITVAGYLISVRLHYDESYAEFVLWGFWADFRWFDIVCCLNAAALISFGSSMAFMPMAKKWWAGLLVYACACGLSGIVLLLYFTFTADIPNTLAVPGIFLAVSILVCLLGCMTYLLLKKRSDIQ